MFAAIAIGVGIDFSIHFIERSQLAFKQGHDLCHTIRHKYPAASRACFFNATALASGFATLLVSELPTLQRFGLMITIACMVSFFAALLIVPLSYALKSPDIARGRKTRPVSVVVSTILLGILFMPPPVIPSPIVPSPVKALDGASVAEKVWQRADGDFVEKKLVMKMTNHQGKTRTRHAEVTRWKNHKVKKSKILFTKPRRVKRTAFLTYDYQDENVADEQWLYLPALKKQRRIPTADRGDGFMGTDFSYEDIKSELKFPLADYQFHLLQESDSHYLIRGVPVSDVIAESLGYGKFEALINKDSLLPESIRFWDTKMHLLKTMKLLKSELVDGFWNPLEIEVKNLQSGHSTHFEYQKISYLDQLNELRLSVKAIGK